MALYSRARIVGQPRHSVLKVVTLDDFLREDLDVDRCALLVDDSAKLARSRATEDLPWGALIHMSKGASYPHDTCAVSEVRNREVVQPGDVIGVRRATGLISSLYRRGSKNNALLVTERCNSYCIMCSQPPLVRDETGLLDELVSIVQLVDRDEEMLGITGGEPTLLGDGLFRLFDEVKRCLPSTGLHVLTNGRTFQDREFAKQLMERAPANTIWAVPLYTDSPEIHDYVVQSSGAFSQTVRGLWHLSGLGARVELRIVLQRAVVPRLTQFAHFVARNLSYVDHVAWMGLEPMGFAKPNWKGIWVEPAEYVDSLSEAISILDRYGITTSIFNVPLCLLPTEIRPYAANSISDWKRTYLPICDVCPAKSSCGGFFASAVKAFSPNSVHPIELPMTTYRQL